MVKKNCALMEKKKKKSKRAAIVHHKTAEFRMRIQSGDTLSKFSPGM